MQMEQTRRFGEMPFQVRNGIGCSLAKGWQGFEAGIVQSPWLGRL